MNTYSCLLQCRMLWYCWCRRLDGKKTPEPVFKNPRVGNLFTKWRQVWLMAMERRRRLQDALDRLNEVNLHEL